MHETPPVFHTPLKSICYPSPPQIEVLIAFVQFQSLFPCVFMGLKYIHTCDISHIFINPSILFNTLIIKGKIKNIKRVIYRVYVVSFLID